MERVPYILPLLAYGFVAFVHLLPGVVPERFERWTRPVGAIGAAIHLVALALIAWLSPLPPGFPEALSAASLSMMVAWVAVGKGRLKALGLLLAPLAIVTLGTSLFVPHRQVAALAETGPSPWLPVHLGLTFAGLAGFALAFAVGIVYLVVRRQLKRKRIGGIRRLPSLEVLDRIQFRSMLFGFVFLTLGIGAGGVWAAASLQEPWTFDPKVVFTVVVWLWYGIALQVRLVAGWRGRWSALFSIVGFGGMLFSLVVSNFIFSGFHAYGG